MQFTEHFSFEELTDSSHKDLVSENRKDAIKYLVVGKKLAELLETIRHILGDKPLKINSGFRNYKLNLAVGSKAKVSKHMLFEAVDITPAMGIKEAFSALIMAYKGGLLPNLRKVLQEGTWLHIEVSTNQGDHRGFFISRDGNKTFERVA